MMTQNVNVQTGQCINFGNCSKANAREVIVVNMGDDFICPECEGGLMAPPPNGGFSPAMKWILIIAGIIAVFGAGGYFGYKFIADRSKPTYTDIADIIEQEEQVTELSHSIIPEGIILDKNSLEFKEIDASEQLIAIVFPNDVPENNKTIIWRSGDETVAKVDSTGLVTTVAYGSTVITAFTLNGLSDTCSVQVRIQNVPNNQTNVPGTARLNNLLIRITNSDDNATDEARRLLGNSLRVEGASNISNVQQLITDVSNGSRYQVTQVNTDANGKLVSITVRKL